MKIKDALAKKEMKQVWLAKELGIGPNRLSLIVNEWVPVPQRLRDRLAELLGLSVKDLEPKNKKGKTEK